MKGTEDEVTFGDMIEMDLTKDLPNGSVKHKHLECKFIPEIVPLLLEEEVIEEVNIKEEEEEDTESCPVVESLIKANEDLELRVDNLESAVATLKAMIKKVVA